MVGGVGSVVERFGSKLCFLLHFSVHHLFSYENGYIFSLKKRLRKTIVIWSHISTRALAA